jgi:transposase
MGRKRQLKLSDKEVKSLEYMSLHDSSPLARQRCTIVILNNLGMTNVEIQSQLGCSSTTITNSLDRYEYDYPTKGLKCMLNKGGQGRKAALTDSDAEIVRTAVEEERQKLSLAKLIIEANKGIQLSDYQLRLFLKSLVVNTND